MSLSLYLVVIDSTGAAVQGNSNVARLSNPFRGNAPVAKPFELTTSSFGVDVPTSAGGTGRADVGELIVTMTDDRAAAVLFRAAATGRRFRSIDMLAVNNGERPGVVSGVGVGNAFLSNIAWTATTSGVLRSLRVDGRVFSVGSAYQNVDGSYSTFDIASFDTSTGSPG